MNRQMSRAVLRLWFMSGMYMSVILKTNFYCALLLMKEGGGGGDIFNLINDFFGNEGLSWQRCCGVCTDGARAMLRVNSGFIAHIKWVNPRIITNHCMIHREVLATKTLPDELKLVLKTAVDVVNYIKSSALNTRLFRNLCIAMDASHQSLLFHTEVRWLSKGNVLLRICELWDEISKEIP